jgi:ElaB/YqjD/DUF883 family membrane-anchored ribosome-binding protein
METNNCAVDETAETTGTQNCSSSSTGFENVINSIADALHKAAGAIGEKTAGEDSRSCLARFGMQTSEQLDRSAGYIRRFDCKPADAGIREFVRQSPGRSLLLAGAVGLIIGVILRRK